MPKFRKKPVVIEAFQLTLQNQSEIAAWCGGFCYYAQPAPSVAPRPSVGIETLEGVMTADIGDWIIKGVNGEFYPCKPDIFEKTYEPAEEPVHAA